MELPLVVVSFDRTAKVEHVRYETISTPDALIQALNRVRNGESAWVSEAIITYFIRELVDQKKISFQGHIEPGSDVNIGGRICKIREQDVIDAIVTALTVEAKFQPKNIPPII